MTLIETFEIHDQLNPKIWKDDKLIPEVKDKILTIVDEFIDSCDVSFDPLDVQIVGSMASFNYTATSDLDIHLIVNFDDLEGQMSEPIAQTFFNLQKNEFNHKYDITIKGYEASIYVEDVNSGIHSNGIYSVYTDTWVKVPKKLDNIKQYDNSQAISRWKEKVSTAVQNNSLEDLEALLNALYLIRKNSLAVDGEYGQGNQLFKSLRNENVLFDLKDKITELKTAKMSLQ